MRAAHGKVVRAAERGGLVLAAVLLTAAASDPSDYPRARDVRTLKSFLLTRAGLPASQIALLTAASAFAVTTPKASGGAGAAEVREEVLDPKAAERLGGRSARLRLQLDCEAQGAVLLDVEVYAEHRLRGVHHAATPALWSQADPDAELADLAPIACEGRGAPSQTGRYAQIGAFASAAVAEAAFAEVERRLPDETRGLTLAVRPARGPLKRALVGPFSTALDAESFCAKLKAGGGPCFVR